MLKSTLKTFFRALGLEVKKFSVASNSERQIVAALQYLGVDVVFDVGANTGQFASSLREFGFSGLIVSFEPLASAHAQLLNKSRSDPGWIIHPPLALSDMAGEVDINVSGNSVSSSLLPMLPSHFNAAPDSAYISKERVAKDCLDNVAFSYLNSKSSLLLKIDTQGYEWEVLDGSSEVLKLAKVVLIELSLLPLYEGQHLWQELIERLSEEGFLLWCVQPGFTDPKTGRTLQFDGLFVRK